MSIETITAAIRDVPDFPQEGIIFKDISPILQDAELFRETVDLMALKYEEQKPDMIVAIDARGFIFGSALAYKLGTGITMLRKKGKLPWETRGVSYDLEYGSNEMEIHVDAVNNGQKVLLVDDLLATGGTAAAAAHLVEALGGNVVACCFLIELNFLNGREKLKGYRIDTLIPVG